MMIQSAPQGEPHFVITMSEHTALAAQLARAFGNDRFEPVEPRDEVLYLVEHHDDGWLELDAATPLDPKTRLPYNLVETPLDLIAPTSRQSPDINTKRHPYCGLLSSMHSWGLYNGRYGLSDKVVILDMADEAQATLKPFLDGELARQEKLKAEITKDPSAADWIEEKHLFQNYKQLQFFDTLALYFNRVHEDAREETSFPHIPVTGSEDVTITIRPLGGGTYSLSPYPFAEDPLDISFEGRWLAPLPEGNDDLKGTLDAIARDEQRATLVSA
tara:strand:- start:11824 stop:12642 length:819 start_codon:yes stop_codon:yes gene_type:complete